MPRKYSIKTRPAPHRFAPPGEYMIVEQDQYCLHCPTNSCIKKDCPHKVYEERRFDSVQLRDTIDYLCKSCLRCIQGCKNRAISRTINPAYLELGDEHYTPEIITSIYYQAETGKIPVSGAGYRGPFVGPGFDSMWTDMSEIVRPTRDGIHGREYIATNIDLGRKLGSLEFDEEGNLLSNPPPILEIPLPILFGPLPFGAISENVHLALAKAAKTVNTLMIIRADELTSSLKPYHDHLVPLIKEEMVEEIREFKMVEFVDCQDVLGLIDKAKAMNPEIVTSVRIALNKKAGNRALELAKCGAEILHLFADDHGQELNSPNPRFIKEMIREIHLGLIDGAVRDEVTLIASGGVALAEHVAKTIICGADGVAIDLPLLIALGCRMCKDCRKGLSCPAKIESIESEWATGRMVNLVGALHAQLIEVMGAMGIREARRLRGEVGRAMFYEDLERETFNKRL